jgi:N-formylglutamate deformylase
MVWPGPSSSVGFRVLRGADETGVILHVPHSSRVIPPDVRSDIVRSDEALERELALMTDAHTERIAEQAGTAAARPPWRFVNQLSRLVVDPERFPDEREEMARVGMGAVYTRTAMGERLRDPNPALVDTWYRPYAQALSDLVDQRIAAAGRAVVIDLHSYPSVRLPYEVGGRHRPAACLGTDSFHTPEWMIDAASAAFAECGDIAENTPFAGCYVPLKHYRVDDRVSGIMVEIRRDLYMIEPGGRPHDGLATVARCLARLIDAVQARVASRG